MTELTDYDFQRTAEENTWTVPQARRPVTVWVTLVLLLTATGIAAYIAFGWSPHPTIAAVDTFASAAAQSRPSLGGTPEPVDLPPLDASDAVVRTLVRTLSENSAVTSWLTTDDLVRNFTIVVANIADGTTAAKQLKALRPASVFSVVERDGSPYMGPRTYARYTVIAKGFQSLDPVATAKLYGILKPRIEEAHREPGSADVSFDRTLQRAIGVPRSPILDGPVRLRPKGIGYAYADERLERLTGAQKQLLRMGPENVRILLNKLRLIGAALGIPSEQLRAF